MAVLTLHLYCASGTAQRGLQVNIVVEVYRARIMPSNSRELRVVTIKSGNMRINVEDPIAGFQIPVALDAGIVGSRREANGTAVLNVARAAGGSECLVWVVGGRLMTSEACAVRDRRAKPGRTEVAQTTAVAENGVGF